MIVIAVVILLLAFQAYRFAGNCVVVSGQSMEPFYHDGDILMITHVSSTSDIPAGNPVCWVQLDDGTNVIKRLIGYPGDVVELRDGATYVNGGLLMDRTTASWDSSIYTLGSGDYLFLGDNRANSLDGRDWDGHFVSIENIKGVVKNSLLHNGGGD